jgi:2-iminobutanoate/2-iminopropanoate deaminase
MTPSPSTQQPGRDASAAGWQSVLLPDAPAPKGAYSPAVRAGDFVYVSGQVPRDPQTGALAGDDVATQTRQVLRNIEGVLTAAGATLRDVVSVTVYLTNVDDWGTFDGVYRETFTPPFPTRAVVGATLRGILVEISAVAFVGGR